MSDPADNRSYAFSFTERVALVTALRLRVEQCAIDHRDCLAAGLHDEADHWKTAGVDCEALRLKISQGGTLA